MDIRESHSFIGLFAASFNLINRAFGVLLVFFITSVIGGVLLAALLWVQVPQWVVSLLQGVYSAFLGVIFLKLLAAKAENDNLSLPDAAASSVLPTVYTIILQLIYVFVGIVAAILMAITGAKSSPILLIPFILVGLFLLIRFLFAPFIIAVREQNPIVALITSWQMTGRHFFYVLGAWLLTLLTPWVFLGAVGYGLYVAIPLYFADSFNLAQLSLPWIGVLVAIGLAFLFVCLAMFAYLILVFLYLDYQDNRGSAPVMPQAQLTPQAGPVLPPGAGPALQAAPEMEVVRASVKTHAADDSIAQHLDQVYQPKPEDVIEYAEEDRMPTILFDDAMAQQIEQSHAKLEQETNKSKNHPDEGDHNTPIKMSK